MLPPFSSVDADVQVRAPLKIFFDRLTWRLARLLDRSAAPQAPLASQHPWMSPNIWRMIESTYADTTNPSILEYGSGVSTIWHLRNLLQRGGSYTCIEHNPEWFNVVDKSVMELAENSDADVERTEEHDGSNKDIALRLTSLDSGTQCEVKLILRPALSSRTSQDGTADEFDSYINSVKSQFNLVIVDGRSRVACVMAVLDENLVLPDGHLLLHDAGRGIDNWLGHPRMTGTADYTPAVARMTAAGGVLVNGEGLDAWSNRTFRRAGVNAFYYPQEACILHVAKN